MNRFIFLIYVYLMILWLPLNSSMDGNGAVEKDVFGEGDQQRCPQTTLTSIDILPGAGWDNLRNIEMSPVLVQDYSHCRTTNDRKFLIPDNVVVTPVRQGRLDLFAEQFTHWSSYTSLTSQSINLGSKASFAPYGSISGSYSNDYQYTKKRQILDSSITTRVQVRHIEYHAQTLPDSMLHPTFKSRILEIAAHLQVNDQQTSQYLFEKLVRDYGTHYVTGIKGGAALVQEDHIKRSYVGEGSDDKQLSGVAASASGTFFKALGINFTAGYQEGTTDDKIRGYLDNRTSSKIFTLGGPPLLPNFSADEWKADIQDNLVAVDRSGDRLDYAINPSTVPDISVATLNDIVSGVQQAIKQYYIHNSHIGCMDPSSDMFDRQANIGEKHCSFDVRHNFTFGGVYQTCEGGDDDACKGYSQIHPKTKHLSCPEGYQSIKLWHGSKRTCRRICETWFVFFDHCYDDCVSPESMVHVTSYWCSPTTSGVAKTGYIFGGLYSDDRLNPVTGLQECPEYFYPLRIGFDISVCVSDDFELGMPVAVPFAGFFSCESGNPLVFQSKNNGLLQSTPKQSLLDHVQLLEATLWPKQCPPGYSRHLAGISQACEIMYCVRAYSLRRDITPPVRRPPYTAPPSQVNNATLMILTSSQTVLYKDKHTSVWHETDATDAVKLFHNEPLLQQSSSQSSATPSLSTGAAAGLSVGLALLVGIVIALGVFGYRRRNRRNPEDLLSEDVRHYRKDPENLATDSVESI